MEINTHNLYPNYSQEIFNEYEDARELIIERNYRHYLNELSMKIFTRMAELYYSDKYNDTNHMYVALESILVFVCNRLSKLTGVRLKKFLKQNKSVTLQLLRESISLDNSQYFSIDMSDDVVGRYPDYANVMAKILRPGQKKDYYRIKCTSEHFINFQCTNRVEIPKMSFKSYGNKTYKNIPFLLVVRPSVRFPLYYEDLLQIWIVMLKNDEKLMIVEWPVRDDTEFHPMEKIFELLLCNNLSDIIANSKLNDQVEGLVLPFLHNINSSFSNMQEIIENSINFENLFDKCNNFDFENVSKLKIYQQNNIGYLKEGSKTETFIKNNPTKFIILNKPFLHLHFSSSNVCVSAGFFDCDKMICEESYKNIEKERMKYQKF